MGVLGAYSNLKLAARQLHDLLKIAGERRISREPTPLVARRDGRISAREKQRIVHAYHAGVSMKELARRYSIHRTSIRDVLEEGSVVLRKQRKISPAQVDIAVSLYKQGMSLARIGERLDFNAQTISMHLRRAGVTIRGANG